MEEKFRCFPCVTFLVLYFRIANTRLDIKQELSPSMMNKDLPALYTPLLLTITLVTATNSTDATSLLPEDDGFWSRAQRRR